MYLQWKIYGYWMSFVLNVIYALLIASLGTDVSPIFLFAVIRITGRTWIVIDGNVKGK